MARPALSPANMVQCVQRSTQPFPTSAFPSVAKRSSRPGDARYVNTFYSVKIEDPKLILPFMPHLLDCHAKFWGMGEGYQEYSIPYEKVIPMLIEGGYGGYLMSEYEGTPVMGSDGLMTTPWEEVRQQVMLRRLLGEI